MTTSKFHKTIQYQSGLSLLEILITVLILAIGSLGMASLQLTGLKYSTGAYGRTQATLLANDMIDRIRANKEYALTDGSNYNIAVFTNNSAASVDCTTTACSSEEMAEFDASTWLQNVNRLLVSGEGKIRLVNNGTETIAEIGLQWRQSATNEPTGTTAALIDSEELKILTFRSAI